MSNYNSQFTGEQIDDAISKVKNKIVETSADKVSFSDGETFQEKYNAGQLNGKTPIKGEDYYTEADKQEMVQAVIAALPNGDEVSY